MTDRMTVEQRHRCMANVKSKNTRPEMLVRRYLFSCGFRYRLHVRSLPGNPDIVLKKYKTVIFVNGCFWHGHEGCDMHRIPKSNVEFWKTKIERNRQRDKAERAVLKMLGWTVIVIWECQLRKNNRDATLQRLVFELSRLQLKSYGASYYSDEDAADNNMVADNNAIYVTKNED